MRDMNRTEAKAAAIAERTPAVGTGQGHANGPGRMNSGTTSFPEDLRSFVHDERWTYAKTMPAWPHEYLVRGRVDPQLFEALVKHIRAHGYAGRFYGRTMTYYDEEGRTYWTMGEPVAETTIINRCLTEDTFESRSKNGTLPARKPAANP
jgi:hypothetical protein